MLAQALCAATLLIGSPSAITSRTSSVRACDGRSSFDADAWRRVACWEDFTNFERSVFLRGLLDGDLSLQECNHVAWRGLGYTLGPDGSLCDPTGAACTLPPNVLGDEAHLAQLREVLPLGDTIDEEDEMASLDTLIESLHGEVRRRRTLDR